MNLTLLQLNSLVRQALECTITDSYWVEAELSECRESGGHCYMDLIQKDETSNIPIARAQARCWRNNWIRIAPKFARITGEPLHAGMKVLLLVRAQFHEAYGFSWIVNDIDPNYTLGDMVRKRMEIINALKKEGVFDLNKTLPIPLFAQRIAVISSASAAGYGDFCNQLADNPHGFQFTTRLFPATMQGEAVEESIIDALDSINEEAEEFDVVVIIRGGGATSDLSCFDSLPLAESVANFPLPIITGIGHDRDESVIDLIACVSVKTPTAVADFLINNLLTTLGRIEEASERITDYVRERLDSEKQRLQRIQSFLPVAFSLKKVKEEAKMQDILSRIQNHITQRISTDKNKISLIEQRLPIIVRQRTERESYRLEMLSQRTNAVDPIHILRRGYSIALHDGLAIKDPQSVKQGDEVSIVLAQGVINTIVKD